MDKELFNQKTVKRFSSKIKLSSKQKTAAKEWLYYLSEGKLKGEKINYPKFMIIVLQNLLGYDIKNMNHEEGNIEFSFKDKTGKTILGIEAKGTKTKNLFAEQKGYREGQKTPANQLWTYMGKLDLEYGIATNYKDFVLLNRKKGLSAHHKINFEEIQGNEEKLKEFVSIFSKEQILDNGFIEKLEEASSIEEKNFTKEFYKLFHETRLMLLKEFQSNGVQREGSLHFAQLYMNRLMFIFFAEDTNKLERRIFEDLIIDAMKAKSLISEQSKLISDMIISLFRRLDKGAEVPRKIFGFNGGLFREEIPPTISFKDLRDKKYFADIYQCSILKKEIELDTKSKEVFDKYQNKINPIIKNLLVMAAFDFKTEVSVNILGHIFEQSLADLEELKEEAPDKRKKEGIYYTPEYITDYICRNTIIPYLSVGEAKTPRELILEHVKDISKLEKKFSEIKILDPACGSGAFLIKAVDILLEIHKEIQIFKQDKGEYTAIKKGAKKKKDKGQLMLLKWNEEDEARKIIEKSIHGVDINEESVEITKLSLFLKIAKKNRKLIDLSKNIKCGNSLISDKNIVPNAFDWEKEFPFKFDIVIGNPPYVFAREKISQKEKDYYKDCYTSADYQVNTYLLFIEKSINLLKERGSCGLIIPNAWLMVYSGKGLRKYILDTCKLNQIINLEGYSFEGVSVETIIVLAEKKNVNKNKFSIYLSKGDEFKLSHSRDQSDFLKNEGLEFKVFSDDVSLSLTKKIKDNSVILDSIVQIKAGLQAYEKDKGNPKQTANDVKERPYDYNYKFDHNTYKYLEGRDVGRYFVSWSGAYLKYGDHLAAPRTFNLFEGKKIIIREITGKYPTNIIATYNNEVYLYNRSNIAIIERKGKNISLKYIVSVLNSSLISYYFIKNTAKSVRKMFPKIILKDLRLFPFKDISMEEQKPFIEKADLMLKLNKEFYEKKNKFFNRIKKSFDLEKINKKLDKFYELEFNDFIKEIEKLSKKELSLKEQDEWEDYFKEYKIKLQNLKNEIEKTDNEINQMVYKLYGLTAKDIKVVEGSLK